MTVLVTFLHIIVIFTLSFRIWKRQAGLRRYYWPGLAVKLIAGVCLGLVYAYYYSVGDTFSYFQDGGKLAALARENFSSYTRLLFFNHVPEGLGLINSEPRALFLTKITSVFNVLTLNNYWITGFYYSFVSFLGAWFLVRTIDRHMPAAGIPALIAFIFLPSVVFWSSGLLKESLALPALYFLAALFLKIWFDEKPSFGSYILATLSLWVLWQLKYYYVAIFLPVACTTLLYKFLIGERFAQSPSKEFLIWMGMLVLPMIAISFLHPNFHADRLLHVIVLNNEVYNQLSDPEDVVRFHQLQAHPLSLLKNAPLALFAGLFRPLCWEASAIVQILPSLENTIVLALFLASCFRLKRYGSASHRVLLLGVMVYVVLLCILITFSAPNFGTLSRYRIGYSSFFVLIILCGNPLMQYLERSIRRLVSH